MIVDCGLLWFRGGLWQELRGGVDELYWEWMYVNVNLLKTIDVEVIEYCKVVYTSFQKSFCQLYLQLVA